MICFDFHTHTPKPYSLYSATLEQLANLPVAYKQCYYSLQLHPWDIDEAQSDNDLSPDFCALAKQVQIAAIGEVGLDKLRGATLTTQVKVFTKVLELATQLDKPVVLHMVHGFAELQKLRKNFGKVRLIWHNFFGSPELLEQALALQIELSVSPRILHYPRLAAKLKANLAHLGVESDDDAALDLPQFYETLANFLKLAPAELAAATEHNFQHWFLS